MKFPVPAQLDRACRQTPEGTTWLERLPDAVRELAERWSLTLGTPFDGDDVSCAWVALATRSDATSVVLKLGMPHMEGAHEIDGLRFWNGDPTVRLIAADDRLNAMLLERCVTGESLRARPEAEQDLVITGLLRRLWRTPPQPHSFRSLAVMLAHWSKETRADPARWPDTGLVREGLRLFEELHITSPEHALLATDLHAGNVLSAQREPWLVIDPKPFIGDPAYDATQHLFNCPARLRTDPDGTIRRVASLLDVDHDRVRLWMFARAAAEPRDSWSNDSRFALARMLAP